MSPSRKESLALTLKKERQMRARLQSDHSHHDPEGSSRQYDEITQPLSGDNDKHWQPLAIVVQTINCRETDLAQVIRLMIPAPASIR